MAAPIVQSTTPVDGALTVSVQGEITVVFSQALYKQSISPATMMLYRADDQAVLYGAFAFSNGDKTVKFLPSSALEENTLYQFKIIGSDLGTGNAIRSSAGEFLATTTIVSFRTGQERFVSLFEATTRDDLEQLGPIRETDPLALQPTGGALEIVRRVPKPFSNILVTATGFLVEFDQTLDSATVDSTTIIVDQYPALGVESYFASVPSGEVDPKLAVQQSLTLIPPAGTFAVEDDAIYWNLNSADDFLYNTEVVVTVTTDVQGISDATLSEEISYFFTTQYFPLFLGARWLRTELGPAVTSLHDDTLLRIIHKNSIEAWELSGRTISLKTPPYYSVKWVRCQSILDVLGVLMLSRDLAGNQAKTLGDFSIKFGPADPELGAKYREALKCVNEVLMGPSTLLATAAVKGSQAAGERFDHKMRTWDHLHLQAVPGANLTQERSHKRRLSIEYAFDGKDTTFNNTYFIRSIPTII